MYKRKEQQQKTRSKDIESKENEQIFVPFRMRACCLARAPFAALLGRAFCVLWYRISIVSTISTISMICMCIISIISIIGRTFVCVYIYIYIYIYGVLLVVCPIRRRPRPGPAAAAPSYVIAQYSLAPKWVDLNG